MLAIIKIANLFAILMAIILFFPTLQSSPPAEAIPPSSSFSIISDRFFYRKSLHFKNVGEGSICVSSPAATNFKTISKNNHHPTKDVCNPSLIHVAMTLDIQFLRGTIAAVHSILQNSLCPENIFFHFTYSDTRNDLHSFIERIFPSIKFKAHYFNPELVQNKISSTVREALEQPLNYARNYLAHLVEPCVERVIYLDSDVVLVDDISTLWGLSLQSATIGSPEYCHANFTKYFTHNFWSHKKFSKAFSPFLLVFAGKITPIDHRWNQHGLGGDNLSGNCRQLHPGPVSLLHWSGKGKPWLRLDSGKPCPLDIIWYQYDRVKGVKTP